MIPNTKYMSGLIQTLVETGLGLSSAKLYVSKLAMLNDKKGYNNLDFLKKKTEIDDRINNTTENIHSRKSAYTAIVSVLNKAGGEKMKKLLDYYRAKLVEIVEVVKLIPQNQKTEKQDENWIEWTEILNIHKGLADKIAKQKTDTKSFSDNKVFTDYVLLSLYTMAPPRRNNDYIMKIGDARGKKNESEQSNFFNKVSGVFTFRSFKNVKVVGEVELDVSPELMAVLKMNMKRFNLQDGDFLIRNDGGSPITTSSAITKKLQGIFLPKKVGSSMLRHSFLTYTFGDTVELQNKLSEEMSHSVSTQRAYVVNKDAKD